MTEETKFPLTPEEVFEVEVEAEAEAEAEKIEEHKPARGRKKSSAPVNIELETLTEDPTPAAPAVTKEAVETDVRKKLAKKTDGENPFIPATPVQLENEAKNVAAENGFELNRGTSIGARLMARRRLG